MRWDCPHCGATLSVSDEKLNPGWSFSSCYMCNGFALVRRSDVNLIKVDGAPPDEEVLHTKNLEEITKTAPQVALKPTIKPALKRTNTSLTELPKPLPELKTEKRPRQWIKAAIGVTLPFMLVSGYFLYMQSYELLSKAQSLSPKKTQNVALKNSSPVTSPVTSGEDSADMQSQAGSEIIPAPSLLAAQPDIQTTQTQMQVPAQLQALEHIPENIPENIIDKVEKDSMSTEQIAAINEDNTANIKPEIKIIPQFIVEPKYNNSPLRAGPGLNYSVLGRANHQLRYIVKTWKGEWFQLEETGRALKIAAKEVSPPTWIRSDLVR
ncbi:MAG: hypothetical protein HY072_10620, partial [Deltaproteobacteria bacterium]|nr:hypothetical protein [Deltaproteobacteria bacterium]